MRSQPESGAFRLMSVSDHALLWVGPGRPGQAAPQILMVLTKRPGWVKLGRRPRPTTPTRPGYFCMPAHRSVSSQNSQSDQVCTTSGRSGRAVLEAALVALAAGLLLQPLGIHILRARNVMDVPNERSSHASPTARGGGIAVVLALVCGCLLY